MSRLLVAKHLPCTVNLYNKHLPIPLHNIHRYVKMESINRKCVLAVEIYTNICNYYTNITRRLATTAKIKCYKCYTSWVDDGLQKTRHANQREHQIRNRTYETNTALKYNSTVIDGLFKSNYNFIFCTSLWTLDGRNRNKTESEYT